MATTYSTNSDVERRIRGGATALATLTETTPYDAIVVDRCRDQAAGYIKAKLGVRYQISAETRAADAVLAAWLREVELDLVEYSLWSSVGLEIPPRVQTKRDQSVDLLDEIASGKAVPPAASELPGTNSGLQAEVSGPQRQFTRDSLDGVF